MVEQLEINSEHRLRSENLSWDIDVWYPALESLTYKSIFLPLTHEERDAIIRFNEVSWKNVCDSNKLTKSEVKILKNLEEDLDKEIKSHFNSKAFIRLCGRSPKDGEPLNREEIYQKYKSIHKTFIESGFEEDIHTKMLAIAQINIMKVTCGRDAMSLLLTSERVFSDMIDWKLYGEPEQICLREYDEDMRYDLEFRCFVYDGKLTAISQYDHHAYYHHLESEELKTKVYNLISKKISEELVPLINTRNFVADYCFIRNDIKLIELSPFLPCTGAGLYRWESDLDLLKGSQLPQVQFKVKRKDEIHPQLSELIEINWDLRWETEVKPYTYYYEISSDNESSIVKPIGEHYLFFYGTLKRKFQWQQKYLSTRLGANFESEVVTKEKFPLVVGDCGVPYLLYRHKGQGYNIKGELWKVSSSCLKNLDEYEGISKQYYTRELITVKLGEEQVAEREVFVYTLNMKDDEVLLQHEHIPEYTYEIHKLQYHAVDHIQVKQLNYYRLPSTWGKIHSEKFSIDTSNPKN